MGDTTNVLKLLLFLVLNLSWCFHQNRSTKIHFHVRIYCMYTYLHKIKITFTHSFLYSLNRLIHFLVCCPLSSKWYLVIYSWLQIRTSPRTNYDWRPILIIFVCYYVLYKIRSNSIKKWIDPQVWCKYHISASFVVPNDEPNNLKKNANWKIGKL